MIDDSVPPIINAPRRVPHDLMNPLKEKLDELEKSGILKRVTEPTKWVSSLVVAKKPSGKLRICIDPTHLNKAILRHHYPTPNIDEITAKLGGARIFSVFDAKDGFWQVPLEENSSYLTCF